MLDEEHVGGIALAVEIYVSREQWREAVDSLRQIARADVPAKQKRISRMGAADFLEKKLDDSLGALAELEEVEKLGMADARTFERMARIAEDAQLFPKAVQSLLAAAEHSSGDRRAALVRRAARIQRGVGRAGIGDPQLQRRARPHANRLGSRQSDTSPPVERPATSPPARSWIFLF